jgi:DNA-binding transcriptional LysR family regulator
MVNFKRNLTIRHLRLIETLGRELSVSRCAEALNTSQSAISRGLGEIEEMLGARLFERTTRRFSPTPLGRNLIWHAEQMLNQLDRAEADFEALSRGVGSSLDIGIMGGFSPQLLVQTIRLANEQAPDMTIRLRSNFADGLVPDLMHGRCDFIITHFDIRQFANEEMVVDVLYQEHVEVLAARGHPLARRKRLEWRDLADERWVLVPMESSTRRIVERNLLIHSESKSLVIVEAIELHFVIALVRDAGMLTALPRRLARWFDEELGLVKCLPVVDETSPWPVCVARLRSRKPSAAEVLFTNCLKMACLDKESETTKSTATRFISKPV